MKYLTFTCLFLLTSCATFNEAIDPNDSTLGYTESKNDKGETVHVRKKVKGSYNPPVQNITPTPILNTASQSDDTSSTKKDPFEFGDESGGYLEFSGGDGHIHMGVGLSGELGNNVDVKGGVSLFSGENSLYTGFDLAGRFKLKINGLTPFIGAGGHIGDSKKCSESYENGQIVETCEKKFLSALYSELGVRRGSFAAFYRVYLIDEADIELPIKYLWGFNIFF